MVLNFKISYSERAKNDLDSIHDYISNRFHSPETAEAQVKRISKKIRSLCEFPKRFPFYNRDSSRFKDLRFFPVDNYVIFYTVDDAKQNVIISRVIYKGRDFNEIMI